MTRDDANSLLWSLGEDIRRILNGVSRAQTETDVDKIETQFRGAAGEVEKILARLRAIMERKE